jgi:hypothetical protein
MATRHNRGLFTGIPLIFLTVLLSAVVTVATGQDQVTLVSTKDNTLYENPTGAVSNGAGAHFFAGKTLTPTLIRRGLVAFDVAGSVPPGATVTSVSLSLTLTQTSIASGAHPVSLHRALADWGEGTSAGLGNEGQGAPSTTGDATWVHTFFNTTLWTTPGGDFVPTASATQTVDLLGPYTWGSTPGMVNDVQGWLDNPGGNFGWIVMGNEDSSQTAKRFASRQNADTTIRPRLTITYLPPVGVRMEDPLTRDFMLHQNYPNPFNPKTEIGFRIAQFGLVRLRIFDLLGRDIATLVNEELHPGAYTVQWDAGEMASGVYLYRLEAGSSVASRKLLLQR